MVVAGYRPAIGFMGSSAALSFTFVASNTSSTNTISIPASAGAGDLAVVFDGAFNVSEASISSITPLGWSTAKDAYLEYASNGAARLKVNYKVLTSGDLGTSPAFSNDTDRKVILIFRPSSTIASVINGTWTSELTDGNPSAQTVTVVGVTTPLIVFAFGSVNAASAPAFTDSPAMTEVDCNGTGWSVKVGYIIYNTSPSDQSIDIGDGGMNGLQSGYLRFT